MRGNNGTINSLSRDQYLKQSSEPTCSCYDRGGVITVMLLIKSNTIYNLILQVKITPVIHGTMHMP